MFIHINTVGAKMRITALNSKLVFFISAFTFVTRYKMVPTFIYNLKAVISFNVEDQNPVRMIAVKMYAAAISKKVIYQYKGIGPGNIHALRHCILSINRGSCYQAKK